MKTNFWLVVAMVHLPFFLNAQGSASPGTPGEPVVVETGPHQRIWRTGDQRSPRRIVEVGTGMNYWDGEKWAPSDPTFDLTEDAFVADRIHYKVRLEANLNRIGAVTVITPEGIELVSTPVGIGLYDTATGVSAIIGAITNCSAVQVADDTVVYENAFSGACADIVYRIERGTFQQDVVITGKLNPADYGFDPATAQIQIFTEFYGAPEPERVRRPIRIEQRPEVRSQLVSPDLIDELLGFGEFVIGTGQAFTAASTGQSGAPVAKSFSTVFGRTFLIETVDYSSIQSELEVLPDCAIQEASGKKYNKSKKGYAVIPKAGSGKQAKSARTSRRVARADLPKRAGLVIDYSASIGGTLSGTRVFKGDTTYFLTNAVTCSGAVTIEGGVVFKYPTNSNVSLKLTGTVTCKTSSYRPAIFTAGDDDTIGDQITTNIWAGYTGVINTNGYGNPALWVYFLTTPTVSNLRFRYSQEAIRLEGSNGLLGTVAHSQLANCIRGIVINGNAGCTAPNITVNNTLFANVQYPLQININSLTARYYNCTVDNATRLITSTNSSGSSFVSTNSVFANITTLSSGSVTNKGINNGFYLAPTFGTVQFSSASNPFQSVGAGQRYLTSDSSFRNVGITNGLGSLLTDLRKRTTYPPVVLTNTYTVATTLSPQAQRDTDTLDLGYHYDPIDWAVNTLTVTNATLTLTNGVALATFGGNGIWLQDGSQLYSEGTPLDHNHLSRFFNVQEQPTNWGGGTLSSMVTINPYNNGSPPIAQLRFTDFDGMVNSGYQIYTLGTTNWIFNSLLLRDCTFNSGFFYLDGPTNSSMSLNNNLFEHMFISAQNAPQIAAYNNLVRFGLITTFNTGTNNWTFKDNAFDSTVIDDIGNSLTASNNAYIGMGTNRFYPTNTFDKLLTNFTYATSTLGSFYQSTTNLYDAGSRTADLAGLYHHTVKSSQAKETNSTVDIGFHYVAVSSSLPVDTDGDGTPDYLEDRDGDSNVDTGETDWEDLGDLGLKVWITEPKSNSNIP